MAKLPNSCRNSAFNDEKTLQCLNSDSTAYYKYDILVRDACTAVKVASASSSVALSIFGLGPNRKLNTKPRFHEKYMEGKRGEINLSR